jgi:hypothetical protein
MAHTRSADKRRASEGSARFGSAIDPKKKKSSPSLTKSARKRRPPPLKSSFKKHSSSLKYVNSPLAFNHCVKYDDGTRTELPTLKSPPPYKDGSGKDSEVAQPGATADKFGRIANGSAADLNQHATKLGTGTSRFGVLTPPPTPGTPKRNPLYPPLEISVTTSPEKKTAAPRKTRDRPEDKRTVHENRLKHPAASRTYVAYPPLPKHDSGASGRKVLEELVREPRVLKLEEASDALMALRDQIRAFSQKHFAYEMTSEEKRSWPLADLQEKNPELAANCAYVADGSQYGWRQLFTESYSRAPLVNGLLGHYLVEHVLKHTCFGLNEGELASLEDGVLKKYIHYDGFVRSKQLALAISEILSNKPIEDRSFDRFVATTSLSTQIMSTIEPLVPSACVAEAEATLKEIILDAQALATSLRLTGANHTVFRFNFPSKHSEYQLGSGQSCLNIDRVDATQHHAPDYDRDRLRVKIPCWPTTIATVPSGPDMLDFKNDPTLKDRAGKPLPTSIGAPDDNPGAFVTEVLMTPSDVYLEWTPLATPLASPLKLTLWQAIQQAKKERAVALGQPWPYPPPWHRTATRMVGYVLGAAAVGGLAAAAVSACTPSGRSLVLEIAKGITGSIRDTDDSTVREGLAANQSFFSRISNLPLVAHGLKLNLDLRNRNRNRISKPTFLPPSMPRSVQGLGGASRHAPRFPWIRNPTTSPFGSSSSSEMYGWFPFHTAASTGSVTAELTVAAGPQPTG